MKYSFPINFSKYDGFKYVIHKHSSKRAGNHFDLRLVDLHNKDLMHSFALPNNFEELDKVPIYKSTMTHYTKDWLNRSASNIEVYDEGTFDYKVYRPSKYLEVEFHGKVFTGRKKLWKLKNTLRDDVWLLY